MKDSPARSEEQNRTLGAISQALASRRAMCAASIVSPADSPVFLKNIFGIDEQESVALRKTVSGQTHSNIVAIPNR